MTLLLSSRRARETGPTLNVYSTGVAQNAARVMQLIYAKAVRGGWENGPNFVRDREAADFRALSAC